MAQSATGKTNWFAIWTSVAIVAIVAVLVIVVVALNNTASAPATRPDSAGIDQQTGAVVVGTGSDQIDLYFDFFCPHCQDFEDVYGETISDAVNDGSITLNMHPVALPGLNAASGTEFSQRSANALYCVADAEPSAAYPFMQAVFAEHPTGQGLTDEQLTAMAETAGAGDVAGCLADRPWDDLVAEQTQSIPANPADGSAGTPTLVVNGEYVAVTGDPQADITARLGQ